MGDQHSLADAESAPGGGRATSDRVEVVRHTGEYLTTAIRAADVRVGDVILHPRASTGGSPHRVTRVERRPDRIVIHSRDVRTNARRRLTTTHHHIVQKVIVGVAATLALLGVFATAARSYSALQGDPTPRAAVTTVVPAPPRVVVPAPRTAAGYQRLFARLDPVQWGAADGAVTTPLPGGRVLWLFGDTMSARVGGFVHSTAIVQTGGILHVSHAGTQLIPDDDPTHIYWIQSVKILDATRVRVTARSIRLTGTGMWDFADNGFSRTAVCSVSKAGDVTFESWGTPVTCPAPDPGPMYNLGDGDLSHFGYTRLTHPELRLSGGDVLVSTCQGWTDSWDDHHNADGSFRWTDYQPIFSRAPAP